MRSEKHILAVKMMHPLHRLLQGVYFMCRQNQLWGCVLLAFGLGLLFGLWLNSGFLAHCIGFGLMICGCAVMKKK